MAVAESSINVSGLDQITVYYNP